MNKMPDKEFIYEMWAPLGGVWSDWAKPVLFACMEVPPPPLPMSEIPELPEWFPPATERMAVVLDLPGDEGVKLGLAAAQRGYRPVPLYNAVPFPNLSPTEAHLYYAEMRFAAATVDVVPILVALWHGAELLQRLSIPGEAPPVFLLDASRRGGLVQPEPGKFDNRSVSFTTDFPSANFLHAKGIHKVIVVQQTGACPQADLAHTLRRWHDGGVWLQLKSLDQPGPPASLTIRKPLWFEWVTYRLTVAMRLRRNPLGGFGGTVPDPESGGWAGG